MYRLTSYAMCSNRAKGKMEEIRFLNFDSIKFTVEVADRQVLLNNDKILRVNFRDFGKFSRKHIF